MGAVFVVVALLVFVLIWAIQRDQGPRQSTLEEAPTDTRIDSGSSSLSQPNPTHPSSDPELPSTPPSSNPSQLVSNYIQSSSESPAPEQLGASSKPLLAPLFYSIAMQCDNDSLTSLARCSKELYITSISVLYRHITIPPLSLSQQVSLAFPTIDQRLRNRLAASFELDEYETDCIRRVIWMLIKVQVEGWCIEDEACFVRASKLALSFVRTVDYPLCGEDNLISLKSRTGWSRFPNLARLNEFPASELDGADAWCSSLYNKYIEILNEIEDNLLEKEPRYSRDEYFGEGMSIYELWGTLNGKV